MHDEIDKKKPQGSALGQSIYFVLLMRRGFKTITSFYKLINIDIGGIIYTLQIESVQIEELSLEARVIT